MNIFRTPKWNAKTKTWERPLNRKFLRVCTVYRLLKRQIIGKSRALELLAERHTGKEMKILRATVDLWQAQPIKNMLP